MAFLELGGTSDPNSSANSKVRQLNHFSHLVASDTTTKRFRRNDFAIATLQHSKTYRNFSDFRNSLEKPFLKTSRLKSGSNLKNLNYLKEMYSWTAELSSCKGQFDKVQLFFVGLEIFSVF